MAAYLQNSFFSAGYLMGPEVIVAQMPKPLVPDLAAWMIPEGDTAFYNGTLEGVAQQAVPTATGGIGLDDEIMINLILNIQRWMYNRKLKMVQERAFRALGKWTHKRRTRLCA